MLDDCMTNQHRKGHARAQIIADLAHCRGCRQFWADGRPTGNVPETGLEDINRDFLEADFWPRKAIY
jgi:hypothetical protein